MLGEHRRNSVKDSMDIDVDDEAGGWSRTIESSPQEPKSKRAAAKIEVSTNIQSESTVPMEWGRKL